MSSYGKVIQKLASLQVPSNVDSELRTFLESAKERLDLISGDVKSPLDRLPTIKELQDAGLIKVTVKNNYATIEGDISSLTAGAAGSLTAVMTDGSTSPTTGGGTGGGGNVVEDVTPPPAPSNLVATGMFGAVMLTWEGWGGTAFFTEVYRSLTNDRNTATQIGVAGSVQYIDYVDVVQTYYYWVRFVSKAAIPGDYNAIAGTAGTPLDSKTLIDIVATYADLLLLDVWEGRIVYVEEDGKLYRYHNGAWTAEVPVTDLTGTIAQLVATIGAVGTSELAAELGARIDLIDTPTTGLVTKVADLEATYGSTASAAASAAAAALSESNAAASAASALLAQTGAETAESNAVIAQTNAQTAESNASTYASQASVSASGAAGSAASASTSAGAAATSATNASNSASAAATSASNASTYATNSQNAATASQAAQVAAEAARDDAGTQATAAATSASLASGSASDAASSASAASISETNAASSAGAASTSAGQAAASASSASTSAGQASTSASNAAGSASSASTFATNASNSATAAGNSATAAAGSASTASTAATNAGNSASAASAAQVAAESARDTAQGHASAASTSASNASTSASDAASSASAASASATSASTSAGDAFTYAGQASTSATNALTSESNASTYATNANNSAGAAAASQTAAAGSASAASTSAQSASTSATNASNSAASAASYLNTVQAVATGWDVGAVWNFDADLESWSSANMTLTWASGTASLNSSGTDPQFISPTISVDGSMYRQIRVRVRRLSGSTWDGTAYYSTSGHGFSESYKKDITDNTAVGQWRVLEFDMDALTAGGTDWATSTITGIRIDLGNDATDDFEIDWVTIGRVSPQDYYAAVQQEATARAAADGSIEAKYTVKIDTNGYVTGYGLIQTANDATPTSEFHVRVDKFFISSPTGPGITPVTPFAVVTTPQTINGVSVPVGVYMDAAHIMNGTIVNAKIGDAAITNAKINDLSADKITAGFINSARIQAGSIDASKLTVTQLSAISADMGTLTAGTLTLNSTGYVRSGQTDYATGTGFFLGRSGGLSKFSIGDTTKYLRWDGSALLVGGDIIQTGNIVDNAVSAEASYTSATGVTLTTTNTWYEVASATVTTIAGKAVHLLCDLTITLSPQGDGATCTVEYQVLRGTTALRTKTTSFTDPYGGDAQYYGTTVNEFIQYLDTPGAGSFTYYVKARRTTASQVASVGERTFVARQIKR